MHHAGRVIAKAEAIDAMREIQRHLAEQRCDVDVAATEVNALAAGDVKITRHLVQCEGAVDAARIERPIWFVGALWQIVCDSLVSFVHNFFENNVLRTTETDRLEPSWNANGEWQEYTGPQGPTSINLRSANGTPRANNDSSAAYIRNRCADWGTVPTMCPALPAHRTRIHSDWSNRGCPHRCLNEWEQ